MKTKLLVLGSLLFIGCAPRSGYMIEFTGVSPSDDKYSRRFDGKVYGEGYRGSAITTEFEREFRLLLDELILMGKK